MLCEFSLRRVAASLCRPCWQFEALCAGIAEGCRFGAVRGAALLHSAHLAVEEDRL
jgi:hypothetical protein